MNKNKNTSAEAEVQIHPRLIKNCGYINPKELKPFRGNPSSRTQPRHITGLLSDIRRKGAIIVPVIINKKKEILDGCRRHLCALSLNFDVIPYNTFDSRNPSEEDVFLAGNSDRLRFNGMQMLELYLRNRKLPDKQKVKLEDIKRWYGDKTNTILHKFQDIGKNFQTVHGTVHAVSSLVNDRSNRFRKKVIDYCIKYGYEINLKSYCKKDADEGLRNIIKYLIERKQEINELSITRLRTQGIPK